LIEASRRGAAGLLVALGLSAACAPATVSARVPSAVRPPSRSPSLNATSLESTDRVLGGALLKAATVPSIESFDAVGYRYYQLGVLDAAMRFYSRALARNPHDVGALDGRARILRNWGRLDDALGEASRATYFGSQSPQAWNTLGTIMQMAGRSEDAAAAYRHAIAVDDKAVYAMNNLCYLSFVAGDMHDAMEQCSRALLVDEDFVPARNNRGLVYAASDEPDRAFQDFSQAGPARASYNFGIVLMAKKKYADAVRAFEAAYHADPDFAAAHERARRARLLDLTSKEISNVSK
jgi:tetratricopeptide (TPR) repeat protein